jgi:hypothetical protein
LNLLVGLALVDPVVNATLAELAWSPREADALARGSVGVLRVDQRLWRDAPVGSGGGGRAVREASVWAEATPIFSTIDFERYPHDLDRSSWEWLLMPNDGGHVARVLAYEVVDRGVAGVGLAPAFADFEARWPELAEAFRSAERVRGWFSQLSLWPWRRDCLDVIVADEEPRWQCQDRGCAGTCVKIAVDTGASIRLVCECSS